MLSPAGRSISIIFTNVVETCSGFRLSSNLSKQTMTAPKWAAEKARLLDMTLEERRKVYKSKDYLTIMKVDTWKNYAIKNKVESKHKHTLEDLTEFKKDTFNHEMDKDLCDRVSLYTGDIVKLEIDAIVNAANSSLRGGGGVDGAIHRAAGSLLLDECKTLNGCQTGDAKITGGYNLPAKYVIHTVGPQDGSAKALESCYKKCLSLLVNNELTTIAFPCISTGVYGFPNRLAAHIALRTARKFLESNVKVDRILFCTFLQKDVDIYETLMQMYFPLHKWNYNDGASVSE